MALIQKAFSDIITFSRTSNATRIGPTGLVEYAPHNLCLQSQTFDNASWSKSNISITANALTAPDGTVTADKLVEAATTSVHSATQSVTLADGLVYTCSVYAKAGERSFLIIQPTGDSRFAYFNLSTGAVATINGSPLSTSIQSVGNGWYRCSISVTSPGAVTAYCILYSAATDGNATYTGDGTSGIYLWGAQLSVGPYPLDYTPTTSAAVYGPRFDYDPVSLAARGLLIEEQRTNSILYSEQFDNAAWTKARSSITANAATSPDGTVTADQSTIDNTNGFHDACSQNFSVTSGASYTFSIFVKKNVGIEAVYFYTNANSSGAIAKFNLTTGAYIGNASGNGYVAFSSYSSTALANGWYRIVATITANTTGGVTFTLGMSTNTADTVTTLTGNGTDNFYLWGAQLEAGSFATSYIPTVASTVTRSADVASVDTLSPWYNETEGTIYTEYDIIGKTTTFGMASQIDDGTLDNRIVNIGQEFSSGDVKLGSFMNSGGSPSVNEYPITSMTVGSVYKLAFAVKSNDAATVANGISILDGTAVVPTGLTTLRLGSRITDGYLSGHLRRLAYYPRRLTDAELAALTA